MITYVGENGAVVAWLVFVLLVRRSSQYFVPILLVFTIGSFQLEHFHLARSGVQARPSRQSRFHLDSEWHAFFPTVLLRREFGADTIHLR